MTEGAVIQMERQRLKNLLKQPQSSKKSLIPAQDLSTALKMTAAFVIQGEAKIYAVIQSGA